MQVEYLETASLAGHTAFHGEGWGAQGANLTPHGTGKSSKTCRRAVAYPCTFTDKLDIKSSEAGDWVRKLGEHAGSGGVGIYCGRGGPAFLAIVRLANTNKV